MKTITIFLWAVVTFYAASPARASGKLVFSAIQDSMNSLIQGKRP